MSIYAIFNPGNLPESELPYIYGFCNDVRAGQCLGVLLAEDGTLLGSHASLTEAAMPGDLGCLAYLHPRHAMFKHHYPNGFRMMFVPYEHAATHEGLTKAVERCVASRVLRDMPPAGRA